MRNLDIRQEAKSKRVFFYNVAEALGISEPTMTRKLRWELPQEEKSKIFGIIAELSKASEIHA